MKKMIAVALLASFMAYSPAVFATTSNEEGKTETSKDYQLNKFKDNWMISLEGGANFSLGNSDNQLKFGDRIAPVFGVTVEKWFAPIIGLRLGVDYYGFKGASRFPDANGLGTSFTNDNGTFYNQSFEMIYPSIDVMGDLASLFCGYRERVYSPILYVGLGVPVAISGETNYANYQNIGVHGGLLNRFRVSDAWAINLDIRFDVCENRVTKEDLSHDKQLAALLGVTYKFKNRGWKAVKYPEPVGDALVAEVESLKQDNAGLNNEIANLEQQLKDTDEALRKCEESLAEAMKRPAVEYVEAEPAVTVYYTIGSTDLNSKDRKVLKAVAEVIKANEDGKYVITGYADANTGSKKRNEQLRNARAQKVYDALVAYGVDKAQLVKEVNEEGFGLGSDELDRAATIVESK